MAAATLRLSPSPNVGLCLQLPKEARVPLILETVFSSLLSVAISDRVPQAQVDRYQSASLLTQIEW